MNWNFPDGPVVKTSNAGGAGSISGWGAKIPHALWPKNQNIKQKKQYCNKFNKKLKKYESIHKSPLDDRLLLLEYDYIQSHVPRAIVSRILLQKF